MLVSLVSPSLIPSKMEQCEGCHSTESAHRLVFCVICSKEYCPSCTAGVFPSRDRIGICLYCGIPQLQQDETPLPSSDFRGTPHRDFHQQNERRSLKGSSPSLSSNNSGSDPGRMPKKQVVKSGILPIEMRCGRCEKAFTPPPSEYRIQMPDTSMNGRIIAIAGADETTAFFCTNCGQAICLDCTPGSFQGGCLYCRQCFPHPVRWKIDGVRQLIDEALLSELYTGAASATVSAEPAHLPRGATPANSKYRQLTNKKLIGKGGQAAVYTCENADHEVVVSKEMVFNDDETFEAQRRQAERMQLLSHSHMIRYLDVISDSSKRSLHIILPYYPKGDLKQFIANHSGPVPTYTLLSITLQLTTALVYLHHQRPPLVHGDVKPENVLLLNNDQVLLMDLDICGEEGCPETSSGTIPSHSQNFAKSSASAFTCEYSAPEIAKGYPKTIKADIFSLGVVTYALAALPSEIFLVHKGVVRLFSDAAWEHEFSALEQILCQAIRKRSPSYPAELQTLIMDMLRYHPEDRPTATDVESRLSKMMMRYL